MHWAVPCISNLAKRESEAAPKSRRLQMMARVRLDVSHVSSCVTARREKVTRYKRVSQRTFEVHARSDYTLYAWEFLSILWERTLHGSLRVLECLLLKYLVVQSLTWALECDRPQRRRSILLQVLEVDRDEGRRLKRCARRSKFDEVSSNVLVNRQDQRSWVVRPYHTHLYSVRL